MKKKLFISTGVLIVLAGAGYLFLANSSSNGEVLPKVKAERGTVIDKALAVGTIEPENEISVKSKISGVVSHIFTDVGAYARAGQPLLEVKPDPTPLELADAKRQAQLAQVEVTNMKREKVRQD
ncbi:MAG: efflux RND transporter periplasmic adaptor subunit, partial [Bacteroidota bacterium]